eukprot:TRINITY_DN60584_c0_g1_i1.p1 TRINITY_DN60584_c0_g1~~TRINITY_DN60584_c0_g1_i1.p1  ORF type:complete len:1481 (+),score=308.22 TRINITY_DN60584_c0_g1_i1:70-4512(+)
MQEPHGSALAHPLLPSAGEASPGGRPTRLGSRVQLPQPSQPSSPPLLAPRLHTERRLTPRVDSQREPLLRPAQRSAGEGSPFSGASGAPRAAHFADFAPGLRKRTAAPSLGRSPPGADLPAGLQTIGLSSMGPRHTSVFTSAAGKLAELFCSRCGQSVGYAEEQVRSMCHTCSIEIGGPGSLERIGFQGIDNSGSRQPTLAASATDDGEESLAASVVSMPPPQRSTAVVRDVLMRSHGTDPGKPSSPDVAKVPDKAPDDPGWEPPTFQPNSAYKGLTNVQIRSKMRQVVLWWSVTQLFSGMAMPAWLAVFGTQWYTAYNLNPGEIALVVTLTRCTDIFTDPCMAYKLRSKTMHNITWFTTAGSLLQAICFSCLFIPFKPLDPAGGQFRVLIQYACCYVCFFLGDTLVGTPNNTLGTMLKSENILDTYHHDMGLARSGAMKIAGILVLGIALLINGNIVDALGIEYGPEDGVSSGYTPVTNFINAIVAGSLHFFFNTRFGILLRGFRDSTLGDEPEAVRGGRRGMLEGFADMMTSAFNNRFFRQLIGAFVCDVLTITLVTNLMIWYVRHVVEPEMAIGCRAYDDPANEKYRPPRGLFTQIDTWSFECNSKNVTMIGIVCVIIGAIVGNVMWNKKLAKERDSYGNSNVYHNWLLYNLTSALTNGLMVFVGRGDSRIFCLLCFLNGLPIGAEFMTDKIVLFLITSDAWLYRSDRTISEEQLATELNAHTTKFYMMKTFIPKVVSLMAEALPLSIVQVWWKPARSLCDLAPELGGPPTPISDTQACNDFLIYNDTGQPRYVPQDSRVRDVISFFFFILPTGTAMVSYYLKTKFQLTDTSEIVALQALHSGCAPRRRQHGKGMAQAASRARARRTLAEGLALQGQELTSERLERIIQTLQDALDEPPSAGPVGGGAGSPAASAARVLLHGRQQQWSGSLHRRPVEDSWAGLAIPTTAGQHLFAIPADAAHTFNNVPLWILTRACANADEFATCPLARSPDDGVKQLRWKGALHGALSPLWVPPNWVADILARACDPLRASLAERVSRVSSHFGWLKYAGWGIGRGKPRADHAMLWGISGRRTVDDFRQRVLGSVALAMLTTLPDWSESDASEFVREAMTWDGWAHESWGDREGKQWEPRSDTFSSLKRMYESRHGPGSLRQELVDRGLRHTGRIKRRTGGVRLLRAPDPTAVPPVASDPAAAGASDAQRKRAAQDAEPIFKALRCQVAYERWRALGFAGLMMAIVVTVAAAWGGIGPVAASKWSASLTVPMLLCDIGLVVFTYYSGLERSLPPPETDASMGARDLFALAVCHFNIRNLASALPLIFSGDGEDRPPALLQHFQVVPSHRSGEDHNGAAWDADDHVSYLLFVPGGALDQALRRLRPAHRLLDLCALLCEMRADELADDAASQHQLRDPAARSVCRWDVVNVAPDAAVATDLWRYGPPQQGHPYQCLVYSATGFAQAAAAERRAATSSVGLEELRPLS